MKGLRESKKEATRAQIARAAAQLALDQGADSLTVAAVSEAAGVSPRTFHNYFGAMDEALLEFVVRRVDALIEELQLAPSGAGLFDAVEWVLIRGLRDHTPLDSFATLFRIADLLVSMRGGAIRELQEQLRPIFEKLRNLAPHLNDFQAKVAINASVAIAQAALEQYFELPEPKNPGRAEELVREAFSLVRIS